MLNPLNFISKFIRSSNKKELDRISKIVNQINLLEKNIKKSWLTEEISKSGIIGNPSKSNQDKGRKIVLKVINCINKIASTHV